MKRTFTKRPVIASREVRSYGGYVIGLEESGDQNYYVRIGSKTLYAQTEEELRAAIDKYAESGNNREVLDQLSKQYVRNATEVYAETEGTSRVVAIQLDVEIPDGVSSDDVINFFEDALANATVQEFHIAGAEFVEDLTDVYEKQYPDLLVYR